MFVNAGGQVKDWGKISGVFGGLNAPLTVGDEFGCSIANIGDLDKDGVPDLAVGACGDDDVKYGEFVKQGAAGAVYILFMKWDGTVKNHKKISARSGNLITGPKYVNQVTQTVIHKTRLLTCLACLVCAGTVTVSARRSLSWGT